MILMLEDDEERLRRFRAVLSRTVPDLPLRVWRSAWAMRDSLPEVLPAARLISLDHDLEPMEGEDDPGTGYDVVKALAALPPVCPVIIHTSNGARGTWMEGELELGGWDYSRVGPLGDDWIERDWRRCVRQLLRRPRNRKSQGGAQGH